MEIWWLFMRFAKKKYLNVCGQKICAILSNESKFVEQTRWLNIICGEQHVFSDFIKSIYAV